MSDPVDLTPRQRAQKAVRLRELAEELATVLGGDPTPAEALAILTDDVTRFHLDPALPPRKLAVAILGVVDPDDCGPGEVHAVTALVRIIRELTEARAGGFGRAIT